jgi:hypothetical protein
LTSVNLAHIPFRWRFGIPEVLIGSLDAGGGSRQQKELASAEKRIAACSHGHTRNDPLMISFRSIENSRAAVPCEIDSKRRDQVCSRFKDELGYAYVTPFPIFEKQDRGRIMYYMIHATDHPAAPKLMAHAYNTAVQPPEPESQLLLALEHLEA